MLYTGSSDSNLHNIIGRCNRTLALLFGSPSRIQNSAKNLISFFVIYISWNFN